METNVDIDGLMRQTQRREYEDGLRDFQLGVIFLMIGLVNGLLFTPAGLELFLKTVIRYQDLWIVGLVGLIGLALLLLFGSERVMERIRRATFWRESGFVKPLRRGVLKNSVMVLATIVLLGVIIGSVWLMSKGVLSQDTALRSIPASAGLATAIVFISLGQTLQIKRYLAAGISGAVLSAVILFVEMTFANSYILAGFGWAVIFAASGIWALNWAIRDLRGRAING